MLDRFSDLCLSGEETEGLDNPGLLARLAENISTQCADAAASTLPPQTPTGTFEQLWLFFEMETLLRELKTKIFHLDQKKGAGELAFFAARLKTKLKKLDQ